MRLLDLFCGAGGAAFGYHRAGFDEIVGVDIAPQPRYPFEFVQADALEYVADHGYEFDAIHASPPCQGYSIMHNLPWLRGKEYPLLILPTIEMLEGLGKPYVVENVMGARHGSKTLKKRGLEAHGLKAGWLCGTMFGLPFYRHRLFATNWLWLAPGHPKHELNLHPRSERYIYGGTVRGLPGGAAGLDVRPRENPVNSAWRQYHDGALNIPTTDHRTPEHRGGSITLQLPKGVVFPDGTKQSISRGALLAWQGNGDQANGVGIGHAKGWRLAAEAMGIDWMKRDELTQAIPPAYTEFIGRQLHLTLAARGSLEV